ncbi:MAG: CoA-binding protein [Candidatus Nanoarchaeia archaeon]|nr:CoA-binding protein [Candidatus Nanoarchaeia archaeon]
MINSFFSPSSVAVIGASRHPGKVGYEVLRNISNKKIKVYPVNPAAKVIMGEKVYASVLDIKGVVDLAVVCIPAEFVPQVVEECGKKNIKNIIIISAGFSEVGQHGKEMEDKVLKIAKKYKIRIVGPNCLGVIVPKSELNASFFSDIPCVGETAFISQSGALGVAILDWSLKSNFCFSGFVSVGNMADVSFSELIEYFGNDKNTKVIALYIESVKKGKEFMEVCRKVSKKKPIIILKAGETEEGVKAASSHTGALAGNYKVYEAAFKQVGAVQVETLEELFTTAEITTKQGIPKGKRVCVLTNAGGPGVLCADALAQNKLNIVAIPSDIKSKLNELLPKSWSKNNPIDVIGDAKADRYKHVLEIFSQNPFFDILICILTPQSMTEPEKTAELLVGFNKKTKIPCFASFIGGNKIEKAEKILKENNIPNFFDPNKIAKSLGKMIK